MRQARASLAASLRHADRLGMTGAANLDPEISLRHTRFVAARRGRDPVLHADLYWELRSNTAREACVASVQPSLKEEKRLLQWLDDNYSVYITSKKKLGMSVSGIPPTPPSPRRAQSQE